MTLPSEFDETHFPLSREFINGCRSKFIVDYLKKDDVICDIGNQGKEIPELKDYKLVTLDVTPDTKPDIVADITVHNSTISDNYFDALLCTEVLEHVVDPFAAVRELRRIVKVGGYILFTTPLNSRIHGPVPDCWRFTEFGLKVMFRDFEMIEFKKFNTPGRNLFPLQYCAIVRKHKADLTESDPRKMTFQRVD
jgi:SAM-dependent methyltransferase